MAHPLGTNQPPRMAKVAVAYSAVAPPVAAMPTLAVNHMGQQGQAQAEAMAPLRAGGLTSWGSFLNYTVMAIVPVLYFWTPLRAVEWAFPVLEPFPRCAIIMFLTICSLEGPSSKG